jgi:hypothetical protein
MDNLRAGDICWQRAKILEENGPKVLIAVNDKVGTLTKRDEMRRDFFYSQFKLDPQNPKLFLRRVRVEEVDEEEQIVRYVRLDERQEPASSSQSLNKEIFKNTYFVPGH